MQLLELNDQEITWYDNQGQRTSEPGAALVENNATIYGEPALARARLAPRGFQDQHWQLLNSDSLAVTAPGVENNADLVYRHLQQLAESVRGSDSPLICAVPGTVSNDQLGLLLGIAQEAGINISSFVNSALLYSLDISLPGKVWCIDVQNRRGILTELKRDSQSLAQVDSTDLPQLGMNGFIDGWLDLLTDQFVARSRFDPLRVAETEQQLFDQVRAWLPRGGPLSAAVDHQNNQRAVDLSFEEAAGRAQQRYREAHRKLPAQATVVLTPMAAMLPGFATYLTGHGHTVAGVDSNTLWTNAQQCPELIDPPAVHFLSSLTTRTVAANVEESVVYATHALRNNVAMPLAKLAQSIATLAGSDSVGYQVSAASDGITINDKHSTTSAPLSPGDRLKIGDRAFVCIQVRDGKTT